MMLLFITIVILCHLLILPNDAAVPVPSGDAVLKRCGAKYCDLQEYCSSFHNQCESCKNICDSTSHNFDHHECIIQCQDYLREYASSNKINYEDDISRLQKQQTIILIILIILVILLGMIHGCQCVRWMYRRGYISSIKIIRQRKGDTGSKTNQQHTETLENPNTQSPHLNRKNNGPPYGLDGFVNSQTARSTIYSISGVEGSTIQTVSTPISRYPAEDSTLAYTYDNAGLQSSAVSDKPRAETTF